MNIAVELAKNPAAIVESQNDGRFKKGSERARAAGRKGGSRPHPVGSRTGATYKHRGYTIKWDDKKHLWEATNKTNTVYERSYEKTKEAVDGLVFKEKYRETK